MESVTDLGDQWIPNIEERQLFNTDSKFWIYFNRNSTILCYSLQSFEEFKQPKSKFYKRNVLLFSKSNSQKRRSLCSFPKHSKIWKQNPKVT